MSSLPCPSAGGRSQVDLASQSRRVHLHVRHRRARPDLPEGGLEGPLQGHLAQPPQGQPESGCELLVRRFSLPLHPFSFLRTGMVSDRSVRRFLCWQDVRDGSVASQGHLNGQLAEKTNGRLNSGGKEVGNATRPVFHRSVTQVLETRTLSQALAGENQKTATSTSSCSFLPHLMTHRPVAGLATRITRTRTGRRTFRTRRSLNKSGRVVQSALYLQGSCRLLYGDQRDCMSTSVVPCTPCRNVEKKRGKQGGPGGRIHGCQRKPNKARLG